METQIKNKSILIDPEQHQKVKVLADQFKVSVKQLVEDMINYSHKTGFNPTVMTRDRVMEKLNQIQKSIESQGQSDISKIQSVSMSNNQILHGIKDDFQKFYSVVNQNKDFAERKTKYELSQIIDLAEKTWSSQYDLYKTITGLNPEALHYGLKRLGFIEIGTLDKFLRRTKELIPLKNKLLPKS